MPLLHTAGRVVGVAAGVAVGVRVAVAGAVAVAVGAGGRWCCWHCGHRAVGVAVGVDEPAFRSLASVASTSPALASPAVGQPLSTLTTAFVYSPALMMPLPFLSALVQSGTAIVPHMPVDAPSQFKSLATIVVTSPALITSFAVAVAGAHRRTRACALPSSRPAISQTVATGRAHRRSHLAGSWQRHRTRGATDGSVVGICGALDCARKSLDLWRRSVRALLKLDGHQPVRDNRRRVRAEDRRDAGRSRDRWVY